METLFFSKTLYGLDKFHKGISNSFKSICDLSVQAVKREKQMDLY
ncbi:hypothetical protein [Flagellimonas oceani]|nr:hypothetical protein [Allomuricauda oceani]